MQQEIDNLKTMINTRDSKPEDVAKIKDLTTRIKTLLKKNEEISIDLKRKNDSLKYYA